MRAACLGPSGSYSELAVRAFSGEPVLCPSFFTAVEQLTSGNADSCVLPIENSIEGSVRQNLDLLALTQGVYAVGKHTLNIDHRLALLQGIAPEAVRKIYSHEQAIAQCTKYLRSNFPTADIEFTASTAQSLSMLDEHSAGIVGAHVVREGVVLSSDNIADEKRNFTEFLLLKRGKESLPAHSERVFVCVSLSHTPGSLLRFLQTIDGFGLNLTKIESRPVRNSPGEYRFFIEFEGDYGAPVVQYALDALEKKSISFRLLGAY